MKYFDVVIIGAGQTGQSIANRLINAGKTVGLIKLPGNPEDYLQNLIKSISPLPSGRGLGEGPSVSQPTPSVFQASNVPSFINPHALRVDSEEWTAKHFVIASGCGPRIPKELENTRYVLPQDILSSNSLPPSVTIIGAGPVGVSTAFKLNQKKVAVTLLSNKNRVLPNEDETVSKAVMEKLKTRGVTVEFNSTLPSSTSETIVLATGLLPNTANIGFRTIYSYVNPTGQLVIDEEMRTSVSHVHAVGAVTGPPFNLAFEEYQAELIVENIPAPFFMHHKMMPEPFPSIIPLDPAIARIGLTEEAARKKYKDSLAIEQVCEDGLIKLIGRRRSGEIIGAHFWLPGSSELILTVDLLMRAGIPLTEVSEMHHFPQPSHAYVMGQAIQTWLNAANT